MENVVNAINLLTRAIKTLVLAYSPVDNETPAGAIDGANMTFTLANTPNPSASLKLFLNGAFLSVTEDYTISGLTITFIEAPLTGWILRAFYRH